MAPRYPIFMDRLNSDSLDMSQTCNPRIWSLLPYVQHVQGSTRAGLNTPMWWLQSTATFTGVGVKKGINAKRTTMIVLEKLATPKGDKRELVHIAPVLI